MPHRKAAATNPDSQRPLVLVCDDNDGMRAALERVLTLAKFDVESYASGQDLLAAARFDRPGCILLDVAMPSMSGLEVQAHLNQRGVALPVVYLTGTSDIPIAVAAMRQGAADFIEKPFDNQDLVARVQRAIERHEPRRRTQAERAATRERLARLTPREREIMELVVAGRTSKEIARILGSSHRTVEIHRGRLMEKMAAASLAELVRMRLLLHEDVPTG